MPSPAKTTYDLVPWVHLAHEETHPDRLATMATLHGLKPAPIDSCRVLELGCAQGGNLIPMALELSEARFVGIDLSGRQVAEGRANIAALGLTNIELHEASILDVDDHLGTFDYIVCHGVYSWVPEIVREKILSICARQMSPHGVAYVSYNAYPGWHSRGMLRGMMNFHVRQFAEPAVQVREARGILEFLAKSLRFPASPFGRQIAESTAELREDPDYYVYHEYLESENQPFYFHEFVASAGAHGLQYLSSAFFRSWFSNLPPETAADLQALAPDRVRREQYLDFLSNVSFRRSLLCHHGIAVHEPSPDAVAGLLVEGLVRPETATPDLRPGIEEAFASTNGDGLTTESPLVKAMLVVLHAVSPRALSIADLECAVRARTDAVGLTADFDPSLQRTILLKLVLSNLIALHVREPSLAAKPGVRPMASPWARLQARSGNEVTNQRHVRVRLSDPERLLLPHLDGQTDQPTLASILAANVPPDQPAPPLDECLAQLASRGLLLG